ncbi:type II toxin-antitoxin system RelE/ParE family toxin [Reyranella massiliensis]|uniref:type II toxin-antitoxin system RelE/ParE family toxin n=1 Tax=Reyranella massiliensis TaxID=445220 RepID=UPI0002EFB175|nr:type II toxin-antitoxin system RelE/ParE family toxin [Reyranella massiliensis]
MKPVVFLGDSLDRVREFPERVRRQAGFELRQVQHGLDPTDWKPMKSVGPAVREIRLRDGSGAFRVLYVATRADAVYVLHAFRKKTQATAKRELDVAALRLRLL